MLTQEKGREANSCKMLHFFCVQIALEKGYTKLVLGSCTSRLACHVITATVKVHICSIFFLSFFRFCCCQYMAFAELYCTFFEGVHISICVPIIIPLYVVDEVKMKITWDKFTVENKS